MGDLRRNSFYLVFLGLILGFAISSFFSPGLILWYSQPPYQPGVDCSPAIEWGLKQIVRWQIAGMFIFATGLWTLSFIIRKKRVEE